jgi:hypothetical protein
LPKSAKKIATHVVDSQSRGLLMSPPMKRDVFLVTTSDVTKAALGPV